MKKILLFIVLGLLTSYVNAAKPRDFYVKIQTNKGNIFLRLYNETPKHRDNFLKIVKEKQLDGTLFHRVIKNFMIQGGDPDSKNAQPGQFLGSGDLGYKVDAEFFPDLIHKKGVLAAARDNNPLKASSASQFYIVEGKVYTMAELELLEKNRGLKLSEEQKKVYTTLGGTPFLDGSYTVFGETLKGLETLEAISVVAVDGNNRPKEDISMQVSLMKKREVRKLNKELKRFK